MSRFNTQHAPAASRAPWARGATHQHQPRRDQARATLSPEQERLRPGHTDPMRVLDLLITLYNAQHTALERPSRTRPGRSGPISCALLPRPAPESRLQDGARSAQPG
jgi:hypothetical protein